MTNNPKNLAMMPAKSVGVSMHGVVPQSLADLESVSEKIARSGLAPKGMQTKEQVMVAIMQGMELGLKPMQALNSIDVIQGRPCLRGKTVLSLIRNSGVCTEGPLVGNNGAGDKMTGWFRARRGNDEIYVEYSMDDAKRANLLGKDVWKLYPKEMLIWKAVARAGNRYFSDITMGMSVSEDVTVYGAKTATVATAREIGNEIVHDPLLEGAEVANEKKENVVQSTTEVASGQVDSENAADIREGAEEEIQTFDPGDNQPAGGDPVRTDSDNGGSKPDEQVRPLEGQDVEVSRNPISDKQLKRLFAIAKEAGGKNETIKGIIAKYGYSSSKEIQRRHYDAICKAVEELKGQTTKEDVAKGDAFDRKGGVQWCLKLAGIIKEKTGSEESPLSILLARAGANTVDDISDLMMVGLIDKLEKEVEALG